MSQVVSLIPGEKTLSKLNGAFGSKSSTFSETAETPFHIFLSSDDSLGVVDGG